MSNMLDKWLVRLTLIVTIIVLSIVGCGQVAVEGAEPERYRIPGQQQPGMLHPYGSLCQIQMEGGGQGSGTLIALRGKQALVLTCRHVARRVGAVVKCEWLLASGQVSNGVVVRVIEGKDFGTDLALVICERPVGVKPVEVARLNGRYGPWVGAGFRAYELRIARANQVHVDGNLVVIPAPFIGGQSGGALFDNRGRVVAVIVASDMVSIGVSVDGDLMHNMINEFRRLR